MTSSYLPIAAATFLLIFTIGECRRLHCFQCATSTLPASARQDCLDGTTDFLPCGHSDTYCIVLRYTDMTPGGSDRVVLRRACSPEYIGNFCQYRDQSDGSRSSVCVSSCAEQRCNSLPHTTNMDGTRDYFSK